MEPADLLDIFETHGIARKKLKTELKMFEAGITSTEQYRAEGITWWDYCGEQLKNSYPTYFKKLPALVKKINAEHKNSKNYVLFLGETGAETNQQPCLSLVQFQIEDDSLVLSAYQRSSDANLGLPAFANSRAAILLPMRRMVSASGPMKMMLLFAQASANSGLSDKKP